MATAPDGSPRPGTVLHVGCGGETLPGWLPSLGREVRLDVDAQHNPDILASMTDMGEIGEYDCVYCCHSLEHLYPHDVPVALGEFFRVLKPGGAAIIIVPDLEDVKPNEDVLYEGPAGVVTGLDLFYGMRRLIREMPFMAHHNAFISETLSAALTEAGFVSVEVRRGGLWNLVGAGRKP